MGKKKLIGCEHVRKKGSCLDFFGVILPSGGTFGKRIPSFAVIFNFKSVK